MKRFAFLLIASVAPQFTVSEAEAANLPVKAKPVQYVKICTLYGDGFYYIPGSDTCIRFGGYVRADYNYNANAGIVSGTTPNVADGRFTRESNRYSSAHRAALTVDTRTQTNYGTLRTFADVRFENRSPDVNETVATRAFIQWGGFTVGRARSYFDIFTHDQRLSYLNVRTTGDTLDFGINLAAYTVQITPGVTFSVSAEDAPRRHPAGVADATNNAFAVNGVTNTDTAGLSFPDFVANLRVDQAWGYAGVSAALHANQANYYRTANNSVNHHPDDRFGWALAGGGEINLPWGDKLGANVVYSLGASGHAARGGNWQMYGSNSVGVGWLVDGVFEGTSAATNTRIELTRVWSINAAYQRQWSREWMTSLYGGYVNVSYNDAAKTIINAHLPGAAGTTPCGVPVAGSVWPPVNVPVGGNNSCNPNYSFMQVGSRTQWNPVAGLDIGLDVFYTRLYSAYKGSSPGLYGANGSRPAVSVIDDQDVWSAIFRVQRSFNRH